VLRVNLSPSRHQAVLLDFLINTLRINSGALSPMVSSRLYVGLAKSSVTRDVTRHVDNWCSRTLKSSITRGVTMTCLQWCSMRVLKSSIIKPISLTWCVCYYEEQCHLDVYGVEELFYIACE
jgi:hypothetical protein